MVYQGTELDNNWKAVRQSGETIETLTIIENKI